MPYKANLCIYLSVGTTAYMRNKLLFILSIKNYMYESSLLVFKNVKLSSTKFELFLMIYFEV